MLEKLTQCGFVLQPDQAVVATTGGKVRGYIEDRIYTFKGIPYAEAARFEEPHPVSWEGIKNTQVYGDMCPQAEQTAGPGETIIAHMFWPMAKDESKIQTLNIWTNGSETKKPVMLWIHGGMFEMGSSNEILAYDGRNLADSGVVLVSLNHRLNCLGYLDLSAFGEAYANSGNLGQMDLVAALKWIRDNIAEFGGDPENVTIFGQSGGGRKCLNLMATPAAKGLFHKVIIQSSGQQSVPQEFAKKVGVQTMKNLGVSSPEEAKDIPYSTFRAAAYDAMKTVNEEGGTMYRWSPVRDTEWMPVDIWLDGDIKDNSITVPMIIGSNHSERTSNSFELLNGSTRVLNAMSEEETDAVYAEKFGEGKDAVKEAYKKAYPLKPLADGAYVDVVTYRTWVKHILPIKAGQGGAPIWNYLFAYDLPTMGNITPFHCAEIPFVFRNTDLAKSANGDCAETKALSKTMADAWLAFVTTGNPNHEGMVEWPNWTVEEGSTMIFDKECSVGHHHDDELQAVVHAAKAAMQK